MLKIDYKKWVQDLRSGEYKQGRGNLCVNDKYCCLGVLARTQFSELVIDKFYLNSNSSYMILKEGESSTTLELLDGDIIPEILQTNLIMLNDVLMFDFNQIADVVENDELREELSKKIYSYYDLMRIVETNEDRL